MPDVDRVVIPVALQTYMNVKRGDLLGIRFDAVNCGDTRKVRFESVSVQTYSSPTLICGAFFMPII